MRRFLLTLCVVSFILPASATLNFIQENDANNSGTINTSLSVPFTIPTTAGNLIVVYVTPATNQPDTISVSDSSGNTYYAATSTLTTGECANAQEFFYAANIIGGKDAVTATIPGPGGMAMVVLEYSGVASSHPLDAQAGTSLNYCPWSANPTTAPFTTTNANDLVVTGSVMPSVGPTWSTGTNSRRGTSLGYAVEDQVGSQPGTYAGTFTLSSAANWLAASVAFKAADEGVHCGQTDDGLIHIPPNYSSLSPPLLGASLTDPQYGCSITRLTDAVGQNLGSAAHHQYGTITPINANDTYVMINLESGVKEIVDTSGNLIVPVSNMPLTNSGNLPWDTSISTRFYYSTGAAIMRGDIGGLPSCASVHNCTINSTTLHDFGASYTNVWIPDTEDLSDDGDYLWLVGDTNAFLYRISADTVGNAIKVGAKDSNSGWHKIQMMPTHRMLITWLAYCAASNCTGQGQEVYNPDGTLAWHMFDNSIHTDCGRDLNGDEVCVVGRVPDTGGALTGACPTWTGSQDGGIDVIDMSTHTTQCLVDVHWADTEISFRDGNAAGGWVFITLFRGGSCPTYSCFDTIVPSHLNANWMQDWVHFAEEGLLVRIDGNNVANAYRLFHTRSRSSEYYWAIPRGAISRDGKYVVFDSNFDLSNTGLPNYSDVYLVNIQ